MPGLMQLNGVRNGCKAVFDIDHGLCLKHFTIDDDLLVMDAECHTLSSMPQQLKPQKSGVIGMHYKDRAVHKRTALDGKPAQAGTSDAIYHGISYHAPWAVHTFQKENQHTISFQAEISSNDLWNGCSMGTLQGMQFKLRAHVCMIEKGLKISLSGFGESDSVLGYHFIIPKQASLQIEADVCAPPLDHKKGIGCIDIRKSVERFIFKHADYSERIFLPGINPLDQSIYIRIGQKCFRIRYQAVNEENCWVLSNDQHNDSISITVLSAQNPLKPILTAHCLNIFIESLKHEEMQ